MERIRAALGDFEIVMPPFHQPQEELVAWTTKCHQVAALTSSKTAEEAAATASNKPELIEKLFRRYGVSPEQIHRRYFECPDIQSDVHSLEGWDRNRIYNFSRGHAEGVSIKERTEFFAERVRAVFAQFYPAADQRLPDHLIHVTCTGYVSPSAAQLLAARSGKTAVTHAYHMGCYASLPAVRLADALVQAARSRDPQTDFRADIVHTEMCGLHMNASDHTPEQIVVQTLFADGHVKYSVKPESAFTEGFRILKIHEEVIPDSAADMSWIPSEWGMQMTLSRTVPDKIAANLRPFLLRLLESDDGDEASRRGQGLSEILKTALFAVHPGGPKIIDSVRNTLELSTGQTAASEKVLRARGNMSSATLPHVWQEILHSKPASGTRIVSLAFGPGLTIFGALFECL